ncbi:hypothetical protein ACTXT7_006745, partial [Hymenolepis weldensis]
MASSKPEKSSLFIEDYCNIFPFSISRRAKPHWSTSSKGFRMPVALAIIFEAELDKNPDVMLYNLMDEYNFQRQIADSNLAETLACLIKKSEIDRLAENNPAAQTQQTHPNNYNYKL